MPTYWLASYKARGTIVDRAIRLTTNSPYSHSELILSPNKPVHGDNARWAFSASGRDGGVRVKKITFDLASWDFVPIEWADEGRVETAIKHFSGRKYDYLGIVLSQVLHLRRGSSSRWFCSETIAWVLDLPMPSALSPGDLTAWVQRINRLLLSPNPSQ